MVNLAHISPFFIVSDINSSVSFYVNKLGFEIRHLGPESNPFFAIVGREDVSIMLKAIADDVKPVPNNIRHSWARWDAYISSADPDILFTEYNSRGVIFRQTVKEDNDGLYGFELADRDGYVLFFGKPNR